MNITITLDYEDFALVREAVRYSKYKLGKLRDADVTWTEYDAEQFAKFTALDEHLEAENDKFLGIDEPMPEWTMTIREFIKQDIDIDVWDDTIDDGVAFVGPCRLTAEGEKEYADILDLPITFGEASGTAPHKAMDLFWSFAGFTGVTRYNRLFEDKV